MSRTIFVHVGLPKTGTTYLQSVLWSNREAVMEQGLLLPGFRPRHHMWAAITIRDNPSIARRNEAVAKAWPMMRRQTREWEGNVLVSHEFLGGATPEQIERFKQELDPEADYRVIVTARDSLGLIASYWQEYIKHGFDCQLDHFPPPLPRWSEWGVETVDIASVLQRWTEGLEAPATVLMRPGLGAPRDALLDLFCSIIGIDPTGFLLEKARENRSMGLVEAELMRILGPRLEEFHTPLDRGLWLRGYLAQERLVEREGEPFWPSPNRIAEIREAARQAVDSIREHGYEVIGDLDSLLIPEDLPVRRHPGDVTQEELFEASLETLGGMLADMRELRRERTALRKEVAALKEELDQPPPSLRDVLAQKVRRPQ